MLHAVIVCVCVVGVIGDSGLIRTPMLFSQRPLKSPSTPSSQCVVARQPRVRCSRAALFVPDEWFAGEERWAEVRMREGNTQIGKWKRQPPGARINAWANNLCLSLSAAIFLSSSAAVSRLHLSDLDSLTHHHIHIRNNEWMHLSHCLTSHCFIFSLKSL